MSSAAPGPQVLAAVTLTLVGALGLAIVPPLQKWVLDQASVAPRPASAADIGAFHLGNALGAWPGGLVISVGLGCTSPSWIGALLSGTALLLSFLTGFLDRRTWPDGRVVAGSAPMSESAESVSAGARRWGRPALITSTGRRALLVHQAEGGVRGRGDDLRRGSGRPSHVGHQADALAEQGARVADDAVESEAGGRDAVEGEAGNLMELGLDWDRILALKAAGRGRRGTSGPTGPISGSTSRARVKRCRGGCAGR